MLKFFKNLCKTNTDKTIDELNTLTSSYTQYQWKYTNKDEYTKKSGFYLSFPTISLAGDSLQKYIQTAFQNPSLKTYIIGNGFNAKNGTRLIIESKNITREQIQDAKEILEYIINGKTPSNAFRLK